MADSRESFLYKELPVIPCNPSDDSWLIYSPNLKKKIKVSGKSNINSNLYNSILENDKDFATIHESSDNYLELYITSETTLSNLKRSVIAGVNQSLESGIDKLGINIFWNIDLEELILETLKLIRSLTESVVETEIYLTLSSLPELKSLERLNTFNINYHISLTPEKIGEFTRAANYLKSLKKSVLSLTIDKNSIFRLSDLVEIVATLGISKVYVDYTKESGEIPMKEVFVLNLLKAIKTGNSAGVEVVNRAFSKDYPVKLITAATSEIKSKRCQDCFAKNMCNSDSEFDCYITTNVLPAVIKSS